jgi:exonuclease SbcC
MQKIKFKQLRLQNFRKYEDTSLDFEDGLTAIIGKNGAGKSTYFLGVMAVLYDRTAEGITIGDLVNRKVGRNLLVELDIDIDDVPYRFLRAYKHKQHGDKCKIFMGPEDEDGNMKELTGKTNGDTFKMIEAILVPRDVFLNTIYFHQQIKDFFTALTDSKQKDIFEAILCLKEWGEYLEKGKTIIKLYDTKIEELLRNLGIINAQIPEKESTIETFNSEVEKKKNENAFEIDVLGKTIIQTAADGQSAEKSRDACVYSEENETSLVQKLATCLSKLESAEIVQINARQKLADDKNSKIENFNTKLQAILAEIKSKAEVTFSKRRKSLDKYLATITISESEADYKLNVDVTKLRDDKTASVFRFKEQINACNTGIVELKQKYDVDLEKQRVETELAKFDASKRSLKDRSEGVKEKVKDSIDNIKDLDDTIKEQEEALSMDVVICDACGTEVTDKEHLKQLTDRNTSSIKKRDDLKKIEVTLRKEFDSIKAEFVTVNAECKQYADIQNKSIANISSELEKAKVTIEATISKLKIEIENLEEEFIQKHAELSDIRRTETSETNAKVSQIKIEIAVIKDEIVEENKKLVSNTKAEYLKKEDAVSATYNSAIEKSINTHLSHQKSLQDDGDAMEKELEEIRSHKTLFENHKTTVIQLKQKLESEQDTLEKLKNAIISIAHIDAEEILLVKLKETKEDVVGLIKNEERCREIAIFWRDGFSDKGIPSMLIDSTIPFMNKNIMEELDKIVPGKFIVSFDTLGTTKAGEVRDKFSVNILNLENGADSHKLLSGGEKRVIDVACLKVLRNLTENLYQKKINVTFFDEVLDSIDDENSRAFCDTLRQTSEGESITLISHSIDKVGDVTRLLRV